jgi:hypothetical protein
MTKPWPTVRLGEALRCSEETIELQPAPELLANGCNLDRESPRAEEDITHLPPEQLAESILEKEKRIAHILGNIKDLLARNL